MAGKNEWILKQFGLSVSIVQDQPHVQLIEPTCMSRELTMPDLTEGTIAYVAEQSFFVLVEPLDARLQWSKAGTPNSFSNIKKCPTR